jgi:hypothetical protein
MLRLDDPNAWRLALLFGGFVGDGPLLEGAIPQHLRGFAVAYKIVMTWSSAALFYYFFAVFPAPSPLDRKVPWLKYVLLAAVLITTVPTASHCLIGGGTLPLYIDTQRPDTTVLTWILAGQSGMPLPASHGWPRFIFFGSFLGTTTLGLASLISNNLWSADTRARRKAHVLLWGTVIGVAPVTLALGATFMGGPAKVPLVVWQVSVLLLSTVWSPFPFRFGARFLLKKMDTIPGDLPLLNEVAQHAKTWDVPAPVSEVRGNLALVAPECLVPILGRKSGLIGLLVLGQRLSEEPYSGEDKHLLESVASQAGITLENIALAEKMAERMEAERRSAMEMDIARRVQARLFPQKLPPLETLEYVGGCVQAREVGGDYYDFLIWDLESLGLFWPTYPEKECQAPCSWPTCKQTFAASMR